MLLIALVHVLMEKSGAFEVASEYLRTNPDVVRVAGTVQETSLSWIGGEIAVSGGSGNAKLTINISGTRESPQAYVELWKRGVWEVRFARLLPDSEPPFVLKDELKAR